MSGIVGFIGAVTILYFGRSLLIPLTVAVLLSFIVAPLVRAVRKTGLNRKLATILAVSILSLLIGVLTLSIVSQIAHLASSLSQYQDNLRHKVDTLEELTSGGLTPAFADAQKFWTELSEHSHSTDGPDSGKTPVEVGEQGRLQVEVHPPAPTALEIAKTIGHSAAAPLETLLIIFVTWIFVLLDQEGLRDRLIRLIGNEDLRRTTIAMDDAGQRLSHYFLSQFAVNASMGALVAIVLGLTGIPSAILLGTLTAVLRFVPYVGVWIAGLLAASLAAAVTPQWGLASITVVEFAVLEAVVGQLIEPLVYGRTT